MESLSSRLSLYDIFVHLITWTTIVIFSELYGVTAFFNSIMNNDAFRIVVFTFIGYFIGIVFEEFTFFVGKGQIAFKTVKKGFTDMTPEEIQKKNQLIKSGQYHIIEIPLTQAVMSGSYAISFAIFLVVYILKVIGLSLIPGNELPVWQNCMWLLLLMLIMTARYFHYIARRKELIERYSNILNQNLETNSSSETNS